MFTFNLAATELCVTHCQRAQDNFQQTRSGLMISKPHYLRTEFTVVWWTFLTTVLPLTNKINVELGLPLLCRVLWVERALQSQFPSRFSISILTACTCEHFTDEQLFTGRCSWKGMSLAFTDQNSTLKSLLRQFLVYRLWGCWGKE